MSRERFISDLKTVLSHATSPGVKNLFGANFKMGPDEYETKCTSFVSYFFRNIFGPSWAKNTFGTMYPNASSFYQGGMVFFEGHTVKMKDLKPGCIFSLEYSQSNVWTGHTAIISSVDTPVKKIANNGSRDVELLKIPIEVIDSTSKGHGLKDVRPFGGIGKGKMSLFYSAESDSEIVGYSWSENSSIKFLTKDRAAVFNFFDL